VELIHITTEYRKAVNKILKDEWNCPPSVALGTATDTTTLPGVILLSENRISGIATYKIKNAECEIVTLNSFEENKGVGTALVEAVIAVANERNCCRLWLITTNDNVEQFVFIREKGLI